MGPGNRERGWFARRGGWVSVGRRVCGEPGTAAMTAAEEFERQLPLPSRPPRPERPARALSTLQLFRTVQSNSLAAWDDELFDELFVERRFIWGRFFIISDPDGVRRVLQDNYDNYPRLGAIRRLFEF